MSKHIVGEQQSLPLRTGEGAGVKVQEGAHEAVQEDGRLGHGGREVGDEAEALLQPL